MALSTPLPLALTAPGARLCSLVSAGFRNAIVTLAAQRQRARDRAILSHLDQQMLRDLRPDRVADELSKPSWRG